jgi:hypothetical protein
MLRWQWAGPQQLPNTTKGKARRHRIWDALYARGIVLTANRAAFSTPELHALGFADVRREYLAQIGLPTEIVTARRNSA